METYQIVLLVLAAAAASAAAAAALIYFNLPKIFAAKTASAFDNGQLKKPPRYEECARQVRRLKNLRYPSSLPNNRCDLYLPAEESEAPLPVIFWIHGGGFTAGTKDGTEILCTMLCSEGFAVISADYAYAPRHKFPSVARQIGEAVNFLTALKKDYPRLDLDRVIVGGDSAGGHYCAQYAAAHTNPAYAAELGIKTAPVRVKGAILCCAPLDIATMLPPANFKLKLLADTFFNGYFGFAPRRKKRGKALSDISAFVTSDFPPAFITDGNTFSFEAQNKNFARRLAEAGVRTEEVFFDKENRGVVNHEYLFELDTEIAAEGYARLTSFLRSLT